MVSTPGLEEGDPGPGGRCRITQFWEEGSRGRWVITCPHCDRVLNVSVSKYTGRAEYFRKRHLAKKAKKGEVKQ
jgi:phage terminase large subunit GpA-like protein